MLQPAISARKNPASIAVFKLARAALEAIVAFERAEPSAGNPPFGPPRVPRRFRLMIDEVRLPYVRGCPSEYMTTLGAD
jgi:hypothetical protein